MNHVLRDFEVRGTVVDVDISSVIVSEAELNAGMEKVIKFCQCVIYKPCLASL